VRRAGQIALLYCPDQEAPALITERYEAQLADLRAINERLLRVVERMGV
jgi:hypothetical protein